MNESLYDKYVDENGRVDFGRSGGMSKQKEAKRFLSALNKHSELQQKDTFSISVRIVVSLNILATFIVSYSLADGRLPLCIRKYTVWQTKLT